MALGKRVAELLIRRLKSDTRQRERIVLATSIIERGSLLLRLHRTGEPVITGTLTPIGIDLPLKLHPAAIVASAVFRSTERWLAGDQP
jgi:hypothetical protein